MSKHLFFIIFLKILASSPTFAEGTKTLTLQDEYEEGLLNQYVTVFKDEIGGNDIEDIRSEELAPLFEATESLNWGFSEDSIWLKLKVIDKRKDKKPLIVDLIYSQFDYVQF